MEATLLGLKFREDTVLNENHNTYLTRVTCIEPRFTFSMFHMNLNDLNFEDQRTCARLLSAIYHRELSGEETTVLRDGSYAEKATAEFPNHGSSFGIDELAEMRPKTVAEKIDLALLHLARLLPDFGHELDHVPEPFQLFCDDEPALVTLLKHLSNVGLIQADIGLTGNKRIQANSGVRITVDGWHRIDHLQRSARSRQGFIAMAFDPSLNDASHAIHQGIVDAGYDPLRIDNSQHNDDITGRILYEIGRSRFVVADVSGQRNGVYFEAGYAIGRGIPVIWCCRDKEKDQLHFDTRQYNHIFWKEGSDLNTRLKDRILGTIGIDDQRGYSIDD
ncbi:MAG: hypothetical protein WD492_13030 [Alkalispirochaeta sp.]